MKSFFSISCAEATQLTEQQLMPGERLSFFKKWQLRLHLRVCKLCHRFAQQSAAIEAAFRQKLASDDDGPLEINGEVVQLSAEQRAALLQRLRSAG